MGNVRFDALQRALSHTSVKVTAPDGKVKDYFARDVFTRERMKEYIAQEVLEQLFDDVDNGRTIHREIAGSVATGIRKWATEHGATHFTHWFQPLTGGTPETVSCRVCICRWYLPESISSKPSMTENGTPRRYLCTKGHKKSEKMTCVLAYVIFL